MSPILISALAGAAGGVLGAGLAWAVGRILGRQPGWLAFLPVVGIGLALTAARSLQPTFGDRLMAGMDELPSVQALKAHYPSDYRELQAKVSAFSETRPPEEMGALTASVFGAVLKRQLPKADAASVYALRQVTRSYAGALREIDAEGCLRIMEGGAAPASLGKVRTSEMEGADMKATTRLLVQTATAPAPPPRPMSFEELIHLSSAALATMPDRDQDVAIEVLREERDPRTPEEYRIMCDFNLALSDQLLALGPRAGGEKIRAMQAME